MARPIYEQQVDGIVLWEYEDFDLGHPSFMILGLPDSGLVGVIAANHLVEHLDLREVAGIDFQHAMPPIVVIRKGEPKTQLRLFAGKNMLVLLAETPVPTPAIYPLADLLVDYALRRRIDYLVSIVGIASPGRVRLEKPNVYWLASDEKAKKLMEGSGAARLFENGYLVGPYALVLKKAMRSRVSNIILLADAYIEFPDPEAAAEVLRVLSKLLNVEIPVEPLLEQAEAIRLKLREFMKETRRALSQIKSPQPILYA
ncbi:MAG: proteasome assembly chaperone family protein [Crenarchaeota archaeon]|nr:proteasome assembly chaperone family protein [Thermoproteota archaeon]